MVVSILGANDLFESTKLPATVGQLLDQDDPDKRSVEISNYINKATNQDDILRNGKCYILFI